MLYLMENISFSAPNKINIHVFGNIAYIHVIIQMHGYKQLTQMKKITIIAELSKTSRFHADNATNKDPMWPVDY